MNQIGPVELLARIEYLEAELESLCADLALRKALMLRYEAALERIANAQAGGTEWMKEVAREALK